MTGRTFRALPALLGLSLAVTMLVAPPALGAPDTAIASVQPRSNTFPERYSVNAAGDLIITGNTLMTCAASATGCAQAQAAGKASLNNNDYSMVMVDIDTDPTTVNSSSADLLIPAGAPVLFAGLYWGAGASGDQMKGPIPTGAANIKLRLPGANSYTAITGAVSAISTSGANKTYAAFANVTAQVSSAGRGTYTVADVKGALGKNHFAGWSLIVVYGDPTEPVRAMSVYDGLASVEKGAPATISVSGFRTPPTGPVRTSLGIVAYEGDLGITGDQFLLNGRALSDTSRPATNYFNSSITTKTGRFSAKTPDYVNQLGFDTGLIDATGRIANNATSATFQASSTGDQYYPAALTFSTELFSPRFAATKSVVDLNGDVVRADDILDYALVLTNDVTADNGDASVGTVITDTLPAGADYVPGSLRIDGVSVPDSGSVASVTAGTLTVRVGAGANTTSGGRLAIGQSVIVTYRMQVKPGAGTVLSNDFRVSGTAATSGFPVTGVSNEVSLTVIDDNADLGIVKSVSPTILIAGSQATYTLAVSNAGPGAAESVDVADSIPAGLTLISASGTGWSCVEAAPTVTCSRPGLAAGASAPPINVTVGVDQYAVPAPRNITNTATVTSATADPNPSNNTSTVIAPVSSRADLAIEKWHDGPAIPGTQITYAIGVRNNGPSDATGLTVTDVLPDYLGFVSVSGSGWTCGSSGTPVVTVTCTRSALEAGSVAPSIYLNAEVLQNAPGQVSNTATVAGAETDPTPGNNSATDTADTERVFDAIESVSHPGKAVAGGPAVPVTVRSYNAGPGDVPAGADAIQTITLPPGTSLTGFSGTGWSCTPATGSATTAALTVTCTLPLASAWAEASALTPLVLQVAVAAGETQDKPVTAEITTTSTARDIDLDNNRATDVITLETDADLQITTSSIATLEAGGSSQPLTFTVENNGPVTNPGPLTVRFSRLTTLRLTAAAGSPWSCSEASGRTTCTLTGTSLAAGDSAPVLTLDVSAPDPETLPRSYELTGIVSSPQPDSNPANDVATAPITVIKDADLSVTKSASPATVTAGSDVTFTLALTNDGPSAARDVYLTDDMGEIGLAIVSIAPGSSGFDCASSTASVVKCYRPLLGVGQSASVQVVARTDASWTTAGRTFTNVVTVTSSTPGGGTRTDDVTVTTNPNSQLGISKIMRDFAAGSQIAPGAQVTYVIDTTNAGPTDAVGATVIDTLPGNLIPRAATGDDWSCTITGQVVQCITTSVLPVGGSIPPIYISALVQPDAEGTVTNPASVTPSTPGTGASTQVSHVVGGVVDLDVAHYGPTRVRAGGDWSTTVSVRNNGPATESGPIQVVIRQKGDKPQRAKGTGWTCRIDKRRVTCTTTRGLQMGQSLPPISITSRTPVEGTQTDSVATVSGRGTDTVRPNNRSAASAVLTRAADLAVSKTARKPVVEAGKRVTYVIAVRNLGPGATNDAQIVDSLPRGLTFLQGASDSRCTNEAGAIQCSADGVLKSGGRTEFRIVARIDTRVRGIVRNTVVASSSQRDPRPGNNRDRTSIRVTPPAKDQVPVVDPPKRIKDRGRTLLYKRDPLTNAGQRATVRVTCRPLVTRVVPRGDFEYCRLVRAANGSLYVDVTSRVPVAVTVRLTAPAKGRYRAMDVAYRYRTG